MRVKLSSRTPFAVDWKMCATVTRSFPSRSSAAYWLDVCAVEFGEQWTSSLVVICRIFYSFETENFDDYLRSNGIVNIDECFAIECQKIEAIVCRSVFFVFNYVTAASSRHRCEQFKCDWTGTGSRKYYQIMPNSCIDHSSGRVQIWSLNCVSHEKACSLCAINRPLTCSSHKMKSLNFTWVDVNCTRDNRYVQDMASAQEKMRKSIKFKCTLDKHLPQAMTIDNNAPVRHRCAGKKDTMLMCAVFLPTHFCISLAHEFARITFSKWISRRCSGPSGHWLDSLILKNCALRCGFQNTRRKKTSNLLAPSQFEQEKHFVYAFCLPPPLCLIASCYLAPTQETCLAPNVS